ncbi:beta strand repeat-containing protein, partial [Patescibacteria group bacterium]
GVPSTGYDVYFDGAGSYGDEYCNINSSPTIGAMYIESGYAEIVGLKTSGTLTLSGVFEMNDGGFNINGGTLQVNGFTRIYGGTLDTDTGGSFDAPIATVEIDGGTFDASGGSVNIDQASLYAFSLLSGSFYAPNGTMTLGGAWYHTGGSFYPGTGTVIFDGNPAWMAGISGPGGTESFNDIQINRTGASSGVSISSTVINVVDLTLTDGCLSGAPGYGFVVTGDMSNSSSIGCTSIADNDAYISLESPSTRTIYITTGGYLPNITVDSTTTTINFTTGSGSISYLNSLRLKAGTIQQGGFELSIYLSYYQEGGLFTHGTGDMTVDVGNVSTQGLYFYSGTFSGGSGDISGGEISINNSGSKNATVNFFSVARAGPFEAITIGSAGSTGSFNAPGGSYDLFIDGNWIHVSGSTDFYHNNGTVHFEGLNSVINSPLTDFYDFRVNTDLIINTITLASNLDVNNDLWVRTGNLDVGVSDYQVNIAGDFTVSASGDFNANSGTVVLDGTGQTLTGTIDLYNFTNEETSSDSLYFATGGGSNVVTITNIASIKGAAGQILYLKPRSASTVWNFDPQGTRDFEYLEPSYSTNDNSQWIGTAGLNISDGGNNTRWNFTDNIYWVDDNNDYDYSQSNNWSNSSGGPGGAGIPTVNHVTYFDGAGTYGYTRCIIDTNITLSGITVTSGYSEKIVANDDLDYVINGPTTINGGVFYVSGTGGTITHNGTLTIYNATYYANTGSRIISNASIVINNASSVLDAADADYVNINDTSDTALDFNDGRFDAPQSDEIYIAGNWDQEAAADFRHNSSTIIFDGTHSSRSFYADGTPEFNNIMVNKQDAADRLSMQNNLDLNGYLRVNKGILNSNSNNINLETNWIMADTNASFSAGTSTVTMDGTGSQRFYGSTSFYNFSKVLTAGGANLTFEAGDTQTFTNNMTLRGMAGNKLNLISSIEGTQAMIDPQNVRDVKNLTVIDNY